MKYYFPLLFPIPLITAAVAFCFLQAKAHGGARFFIICGAVVIIAPTLLIQLIKIEAREPVHYFAATVFTQVGIFLLCIGIILFSIRLPCKETLKELKNSE